MKWFQGFHPAMKDDVLNQFTSVYITVLNQFTLLDLPEICYKYIKCSISTIFLNIMKNFTRADTNLIDSLFSLKIRGEECKTRKHARLTVSVMCEPLVAKSVVLGDVFRHIRY